MRLYGAIDLIGGHVVRLRRGQQSEAKTYPHDPADLARKWSNAGIHGIHIVDLDAAFDQGSNLDVISRIVSSSEAPVQVGGGVRSAEIARRLIQQVDAIVVGTIAMTDTEAFREISAAVGVEKIVAALDYRDGNVLIEGWQHDSGVGLKSALRRLTEVGVRHFLLTCADRDGMMEGPDVTTIRAVCRENDRVGIFASGGVRSVDDVRLLREAGAYCAVIGRALVEETIPISLALEEAGG